MTNIVKKKTKFLTSHSLTRIQIFTFSNIDVEDNTGPPLGNQKRAGEKSSLTLIGNEKQLVLKLQMDG